MIFNLSNLSSSNSSGGNGQGALNFKVESGNSFPPEAEENTIMVITNNTITEWLFSSGEPENPIEGMIWIKTGTSSAVEFNALIANGIMLYPLFVKQYINNEWVTKEAKSYQNGIWVEWLEYLYNYGDECIDLTGGISHDGYTDPNNNIVGFIKNVDNLYAQAGGSLRLAGTMNKINLTNVNTVVVDMDITATTYGVYIVATADKNIDASNRAASVTIDEVSSGLCELDVSALTGEYYISIVAILNTTVTVHRIWME